MQLPYKKNNVKIIAYGTMAGVLLTKTFLNQPQRGFSNNLSIQKYSRIIDSIGGWEVFQILLQTLNDIAVKNDMSISQLASAYILNKDSVAAIILGAPNIKYLYQNLSIIDIKLGGDEIDIIESALSLLKEIDGDVYEEELRYEMNFERLKEKEVDQ